MDVITSLDDLIRVKAEDGPYACSKCPNRYIESGQLQAHRVTYHGAAPQYHHQCQYCNEEFDDFCLYELHKKSCTDIKFLLNLAKPKRSCRLCQTSGRECSSTQPCSLCELVRLPCVYTDAPNRRGEIVVTGDPPVSFIAESQGGIQFYQKGVSSHLNNNEPHHPEEPTSNLNNNELHQPEGLPTDDLAALNLNNNGPDHPDGPPTDHLAALDLNRDLPHREQPSMDHLADSFSSSNDSMELDNSDEIRVQGSMTDELESQSQPLSSSSAIMLLPWLERFTHNNGLISLFDCGTEAQRSLADASFRARLDPTLPSAPLHKRISPSTTTDEIVQAVDFTNDPLAPLSIDIVTLLEEVVNRKSLNSYITLLWSLDLEVMSMDFFGPQRLRLYLDFYWAIWHPNANFM